MSKQTIKTLIDCSAGGLFIDQNFSKKFKVEHLEESIKVFNIDGTENKKGTIKSYVDLEFQIEHKKFKEQFYVTGLGKQKIILGFPCNLHSPTYSKNSSQIPVGFQLDSRIPGEFQFCICFLNNSRNTYYRH